MQIIKSNKKHILKLANLELLLWPDNILDDLICETEMLLKSKNNMFLLAIENDIEIGFLHASLRRDYVEGTSGGKVAYLEGIFVREPYQKIGIGKKLLSECETWAKKQGCRELASDCEFDNLSSENFHLKNNFKEVNKIICFVKNL